MYFYGFELRTNIPEGYYNHLQMGDTCFHNSSDNPSPQKIVCLYRNINLDYYKSANNITFISYINTISFEIFNRLTIRISRVNCENSFSHTPRLNSKMSGKQSFSLSSYKKNEEKKTK